MGKTIKFIVILNIILVICLGIFGIKFFKKTEKINVDNVKLECLYSEWNSADSLTKIKIKEDMLREWKDYDCDNINDYQIRFWFNHDIMKK